jgi:hypothetical protein
MFDEGTAGLVGCVVVVVVVVVVVDEDEELVVGCVVG